MRAGTKENIIADDAELLLSIHTIDIRARARVLDAITRIARAEAAASGAVRDPQVQLGYSFPALVNDEAAATRTRTALTTLLGEDKVIDPGLLPASEDVGLLATAADAPCVYWVPGGRRSPGLRRRHQRRRDPHHRQEPALQPHPALRTSHRTRPQHRRRGPRHRGANLAAPHHLTHPLRTAPEVNLLVRPTPYPGRKFADIGPATQSEHGGSR